MWCLSPNTDGILQLYRSEISALGSGVFLWISLLISLFIYFSSSVFVSVSFTALLLNELGKRAFIFPFHFSGLPIFRRQLDVFLCSQHSLSGWSALFKSAQVPNAPSLLRAEPQSHQYEEGGARSIFGRVVLAQPE